MFTPDAARMEGAVASIQPPRHWHACAADAGSIQTGSGSSRSMGSQTGANDGRHHVAPRNDGERDGIRQVFGSVG
jgi:hypothetical protein